MLPIGDSSQSASHAAPSPRSQSTHSTSRYMSSPMLNGPTSKDCRGGGSSVLSLATASRQLANISSIRGRSASEAAPGSRTSRSNSRWPSPTKQSATSASLPSSTYASTTSASVTDTTTGSVEEHAARTSAVHQTSRSAVRGGPPTRPRREVLVRSDIAAPSAASGWSLSATGRLQRDHRHNHRRIQSPHARRRTVNTSPTPRSSR